ncbi:hypothetical protein CSV86_025205 [Pseudomonas putida CSV86]|uniref:Uncharacterized protein n=1 Tax=Pseudomonas bharatica CSV86 TaxID=1005395 RepID=A0A7K4EKP8_9PSED|nr:MULTISPECIES: hypothetical protein [Pseudomonas]MDG9886133.1 hypothetical protein [Pseudomonas sp. GD04058]NNJ18242.1 hypothetical protein [Pseudomonas bharatica CSV86]
MRVMLAGPDEEEWVDALQGLETGREQKNGRPLLQVILVSKSNKVAFFNFIASRLSILPG